MRRRREARTHERVTKRLSQPTWAGRHDQWSAQTAVDGHEKVVRVEERVTVLEAKVVRLFASVGEHRLKWGIVAWGLGTAVAAGIAMLTR